jgi:N-acetylneuraminic acid mutarotase
LSLHSGANGAVRKAPGTAKPSVTPAAAPWTSIADFPTTIQDNGVALVDGKVYSGFGYNGTTDTSNLWAYDPDAGGWTTLAPAADTREKPVFAAVDGKIYAAGGWGASGAPDSKLEIYDTATNTWTTGAADPDPLAGSGVAVLNGKIYVVGGCTTSACGKQDVNVYDPATNTWSTAAHYPVAISWEACGAIAGTIYCAGGVNDVGTFTNTYAYDPGTDAWTAVAPMPQDQWGSGVTSAGGQLLVSGGAASGSTVITNQGFAYDPTSNAWAALPNSNTAEYRGGSTCGFYKVGGSPGGAFSLPLTSAEVLPGQIDCGGAADVSWLSLDASVADITQPGTYTAKVTVGSDTPYPVAPIGVSMTVNPPKTWGKITGTVTSGGAPLAGVTVQINSSATHYTLKTDKDGHYALWLDTRNNPLQLIAAKDGYQPQVASNVKITKGGTTTVNFNLLKA